MSVERENDYLRDSGSTEFDRWKTAVPPDDTPEAAARVDAMNLRWHQGHVEHEPSCHLCREIRRLREAYAQPADDDLQQEYVRLKRGVA